MREHRPVSIADQIFENLEHDILVGKYARGEVLSELRLSEELGVSRTPIREAIRRLQQENILEDTGRGAVVVGISKEDVRDMYEIRRRVEGLAAARAAQNITDEELTRMRDILDLQHFYIEKTGSDNSAQIRNLDSDFHELLYKSCGSRTYSSVLLSMHKKIMKYRRVSIKDHSRAVGAYEEHVAIYEALAAHDSARAEQAAQLHVEKAAESIETVEL